MPGIEELASRVDAERRAWQGRRWRCSVPLRAAIVETAGSLVESGWSVGRIAKVVGVTPATLGRWLQSRRDDESSPGGFRPVEVEAGGGRRELTLVSPSGYRVEGLGLEEIERLLVALR